MHYGRSLVMPGAEAPEIIRSDLPTYLTLNIMRIDTHPELHTESGMRANAGGSRRPEAYIVVSDSKQLNLSIP